MFYLLLLFLVPFLPSTQNLAEPSDVLIECLTQFSSVLTDLAPFLDSPNTSSSVLLVEVGPLSNIPDAIKTPQGSPLLHKLAIANSFMQMFVYIFKACNNAYVVSMHIYIVQYSVHASWMFSQYQLLLLCMYSK